MRITAIFLPILLLVGLSNINAQNAEANVMITRVVEASADEVWSVLRQMDDIDKYSSAIAKVEWTGDHGVGGSAYAPLLMARAISKKASSLSTTMAALTLTLY